MASSAYSPIPLEDKDPFRVSSETLPESGFKRKRWPSHRSILIHAALISLYTVISLAVIRANSADELSSHAAMERITVSYKPKLFQNLTQNPFAGTPSPAIDETWGELLAPMNMRVSKAELESGDQTSVALPEGGGYLAWLGAFHELHCIKMLRQWNYRSYYHPNLTSEDEKHWASHADHCFDMLRQAAMCHADLSLTTFRWNETQTKPMFDGSRSVHTCVDWEQLLASTKDRLVSEEEIGRLVNPLMG